MKNLYKKLGLYVVLALAVVTSVESYAQSITKENLTQNTIKIQSLARS